LGGATRSVRTAQVEKSRGTQGVEQCIALPHNAVQIGQRADVPNVGCGIVGNNSQPKSQFGKPDGYGVDINTHEIVADDPPLEVRYIACSCMGLKDSVDVDQRLQCAEEERSGSDGGIEDTQLQDFMSRSYSIDF
jgi:hypothetical protein